MSGMMARIQRRISAGFATRYRSVWVARCTVIGPTKGNWWGLAWRLERKGVAMTSVRDIDVAQHIYDTKGWVNSWRLQKLTYYSQAWALVWTGRPLFAEPIQAWQDGPVAPHLRTTCMYYTTPMSMSIKGADSSNLSSDAKAMVESVLAFYGELKRESIVNLTHSEAPWDSVYVEGHNVEITRDSMLRYYTVKSATSADVPQRPALPDKQMSDATFDEIIAHEMPRWTHTLKRLGS